MNGLFKLIAKPVGFIIMGVAFLQWATFDYPDVNPFFLLTSSTPDVLSQVLNWVLVCVLAIVGFGFYSLGTFKTKSQIEAEAATEIVQAYGQIIGSHVQGSATDESNLPYPKKEIKKAIILGLRKTDNAQIKEHLKSAYIMLADWQKGVGEIPQGLDLPNINLNQDVEILAKEVSNQTSGANDFLEAIKKEQTKLKEELQEVNLW